MVSEPIDLSDYADDWPRYAPVQLLQVLMKQGREVEIPVLRKSGKHAQVHEYCVDFNYPAMCTLIRMIGLLKSQRDGVCYLNPQFTVTAETIDGQFCKQVNSCTRRWFQHLDESFMPGGRKRAHRMASLAEKQFGFRGVVIENGRLVRTGKKLLHYLEKQVQKSSSTKPHYKKN